VFIHQLRYMRSKFTARFHPSDSWQRGKWTLTVTGVGFFDFDHGQSGVAPNAVELHPVLALKIGGNVPGSDNAASRKKARVPAPPPPPAGTGTFSLRAYVSPATMSHNAYPTLYALVTPGASCTASVRYSTRRAPRSFYGSTRTAGSGGQMSWSWHEETSGSGGTAAVNCSYRGESRTVTANFTVG